MTAITLQRFSGANNAIDPRMLADHVGAKVVNMRPGSASLSPWRSPGSVLDAVQAGHSTIYRMGRDQAGQSQWWLSWSGVVDAMRGFDGSDPVERTFFTGSGTPKWTDTTLALSGKPYPQAARELAVPAPATAVAASLTTNGTGTDGIVYHVETFVNELGWESAPSPVSAGLTCKPGAAIALNLLSTPPNGSYGLATRRIYRTQPGATGNTEFFFLRELPIGATSTTDDGRALGEVLETVGWMTPPANGHSLIGLWGGMAAMLSGKTVHFCEPGSLYAWPAKYDQDMQDTGVAAAAWEQNLLVLTTGNPVLFSGTDPLGMSASRLSVSYPCVSKRSAVSFGHGVVWASSEGLAYVGSGGQRLLTEGVIDQERWALMRPADMVAARYGRFYVAFIPTAGAPVAGFMIDPLSPGDGFIDLDTSYVAAHYDPIANALCVADAAGQIRQWDAGSIRMSATWRSKVYTYPEPINFALCRVIADAYPVTVTVFADGAQKYARTVDSMSPIWLASGFTALAWQVEVSSTHRVQGVQLAQDLAELERG